MNNAGGVITGRFKGLTPQQINAWAWSPEGINFALSRIAGVAKGKKGAAAVRAIVSQFERPADPAGEIARALSGLGTTTLPAVQAQPSVQKAQGPSLSPLLANVFQSNNDLLGVPTPVLPVGLQAPQAQAQTQAPQSIPSVGKVKFLGVSLKGTNPDFASRVAAAVAAAGGTRIRLTSAYRSPGVNRRVGGVSRSNHLTGNAFDGYAFVRGRWVPLGKLTTLTQFGLRSGNQPGFYNGSPDPVHVDDGSNQR